MRTWVAPVLLACACGAACAGSRETSGQAATAGDGGVEAICPAPVPPQGQWLSCDSAGCPAARPGVDDDGDGLGELDGDCDDRDRFVAPGAAEVCDLRDNDCDGAVDEEDVCAAAARAGVTCPLSFADVRCCGAKATIGGTFLSPRADADAGPYVPATGFDTPYEVVVRRSDTGELRRAVTCAAPPEAPNGQFPFRFLLHDDEFVRPHAEYEVIIHLRWYFPAIADPTLECPRRVPVVRTDRAGAACFDVGTVALACL